MTSIPLLLILVIVAETISPLFLSLKNKGYFPITDIEMTRFNITLEESVKMVDWAINNAIGGEIIVPKLKSYKINL